MRSAVMTQSVTIARISGKANLTNQLCSQVWFCPPQDGVTPFMYAVKEGHTELVQALLDTHMVDLAATNKVG